MDKTTPVDWVGKPFEGYVINAAFSEENSDKIMDLIGKISNEFKSSVYCMPKESLHITLMDWIAPLVEYDGANKRELFESIYEKYDNAIRDILSNEKSFMVTFDAVQVAPSTIFITANDNGEFERIRSKYLDKLELLPNTKRPPTIIHSSLVRFTEALDMSDVEALIKRYPLSFEQKIDSFRLVHTSREPMLEFEVLKTYKLSAL